LRLSTKPPKTTKNHQKQMQKHIIALAALAAATTCAFAQLPPAFQDKPPLNITSPWGFCSGAEWSGEFPRFNPMMSEAGARSARLFHEWQVIQPRKGEWNWGPTDAMVADVRKNNMEIIGLWCYFAPWASADGGTRRGPVKDMQFWRDYVRETAARYRNDIRWWGVWNEFNGSFYQTSAGGDKVKDYTALAVAAYEEVKKIDKDIKVGLNVANFDVGFLNSVIKAGVGNKFDFIQVHPYENLGMLMAGEEGSYLSLAGSLRAMLAANNLPTTIPLWITETGVQAPVRPDEAADKYQAEAIVKVYICSIAQGFSRICWFEARGPNYGTNTDHGIIRQDWTPRPAYFAFKEMTTILGDNPKYLGWHVLGKEGFGFLFEGAKGPVLVAWASKNGDETVTIGGKEEKFTRTPRFITGIPAALVTEIKKNADKPFPWGTDYSKAETATVRLGATNIESGVKQVSEGTTRVEHGLTESWRVGNFRSGGEGRYIYFRTDPTFCGFADNKLEITMVAKRATAGRQAGMGLLYESQSRGYTGANGYHNLTDDWAEYKWTLNDASFNGQWGWNFRTESTGTGNELAVREVRVRKLK